MRTEAIETPQNWQGLKPHPLASLVEFGVGIDIKAAVEHVRQHGYDPDEAIVLHEGMIVDGRHRLEIALRAGVTPTFRQFLGKNAMAYAAKKLFRQHLTASQKALMAATLAKLHVPNGPAARVQQKATREGREAQICASETCEGGEAQICALPGNPPTLEQAAAALNVSPRLVDAASVVEQHGTPAQKRAVRVGNATVSAVAKQIMAQRSARPDRRPGDDSEAEKAAKKAARNNGKPMFDWKEFDRHFGYVVRALDDIGRAYPGENKSLDFQVCGDHLKAFVDQFKKWQRRLQKVKV
jgi:hypothetical protein